VRDVGDGQDLARRLVPGNDPVVPVENRHVGGRQKGALELGPAAAEAGAPAAGRLPGLWNGVAADEHAAELHDVVPPLAILVVVPGDVILGGEVEAVLVTETVKTTPLPTTTEVGLRTRNRSQQTAPPMEGIEEEKRTYHHTIERGNVPFPPRLREGLDEAVTGLEVGTAQFLLVDLFL
jgi:hypothetical protein